MGFSKRKQYLMSLKEAEKVYSLTTMSATLPVGKNAMAFATVGKYIYTFGGYSSSGTNTIFKYDTENDTISTSSTTMPRAIYGACACAVGTDIYIFGGYTTITQKTIYKFDTTTDTLTLLATTTPLGLEYSSAVLVGTDIYLIGGNPGGTGTTTYTIVYKFDTSTGTITNIGSNITPMRNITLVAYGNIIYMFGGFSGSSTTHNTIYVFDTTDNSITQIGSLPVSVQGIAFGILDTNKIFLLGGTLNNFSSVNNGIYKFYISNETIETMDITLPQGVGGCAYGTVGTKIYLLGGYNGSSRITTIYRYGY